MQSGQWGFIKYRPPKKKPNINQIIWNIDHTALYRPNIEKDNFHKALPNVDACQVGVGGTPFLVLNEYFYQPSFKSSTQFQTARGACIRRPKNKIHRGKGRKVRRYRRGAVSNKLVPAAIARRSNCGNRLSIFWREARGGHVQQAMFQYLHREMEQGSEQIFFWPNLSRLSRENDTKHPS